MSWLAKSHPDGRWQARPVLAWLVRALTLTAPFFASFLMTLLLARAYPPTYFGVEPVVWFVGVAIVATATLVTTERVVRRLLPLSALLSLNLVFPDTAPSRFSLAMRTGTTKQLERRVAEVRRDGTDPDTADGATQLLELVAILSVHDRLTRGHCERVRAYTDLLMEELELPKADRDRLRWAALLHDVGKIHVPAEILNSPNAPTEDEWDVLKAHTTRGLELVEPLTGWLGPWVRAVGEHHERWDGGGYPSGLAGDDIHLGARIVAITDAFDVMTSHRSYKQPISSAAAQAEIARCAGTQFDPRLAKAFLRIGVGRFRIFAGPLSWIANLPAAATVAPVAPVGSVVSAGVGAVALTFAVGVAQPSLKPPPDALAFTPVTSITTTVVDEPAVSTMSIPPTTIPPTTIPPTTFPTTTTTAAQTTAPATSGAKVPTTTSSTTAAPTTTTSTTVATTSTVPPMAPTASAPSLTTGAGSTLSTTFTVDTTTGRILVRLVRPSPDATITFTETGTRPEAGTAGRHVFTVTVDPDPGAVGSTSFDIEICDLYGRCSTVPGTLTITPPPTTTTTAETTTSS